MKTMLQGMAAVTFAAAMGVSGVASAVPSTPCTAANDGATESVTYRNRQGSTDTDTYQCDATYGWMLIRRCSGSTGMCVDY